MQDARKHRWMGWALALAPVGWVAGTALQMGQPSLWAAGIYAALAGLGGALTRWRLTAARRNWRGAMCWLRA